MVKFRFVSFRKMADSLNYLMWYGVDRLDYHSATNFRFHIDRRLAHSEVSWVIPRSSSSKNRSFFFFFFFFCIVIFSCGLPVTQINQKSLDSRHYQTSQICRKLFYFPVYCFSPYQNPVTSVVDSLRLALIPEVAVNTWHPGDFWTSLTKMNTCIEYPTKNFHVE